MFPFLSTASMWQEYRGLDNFLRKPKLLLQPVALLCRWGNQDIEISDWDKCLDEVTKTSKFRSLCYQAFLKVSNNLHIIGNTIPDLCAMLLVHVMAVVAFVQYLGLKINAHSAQWLTCCVTSFGQVLY